MRKISEYEQHAAECRQMAAKTSNPIHKKQLEEMADAWGMLARERKRQLLKNLTQRKVSYGRPTNQPINRRLSRAD